MNRIKDDIPEPPPVDRSRTGSKPHVIIDRRGTPLLVALTADTGTMPPSSYRHWT